MAENDVVGVKEATASPADILPSPDHVTLDTATASLDQDALQRLRELDPSGGARLIERVLGAFATSIERLEPQLAAARAKADMRTISQVAHTLKSSSASVGALELSRLCAEIEDAVRDQAFGRIDEPLDAMQRELHGVLQAVRSMRAASS